MRLIDADALCAKCKEAKCNYIGCKDPGNCAAAEMPTIDAEPVRHGRWIRLGPNWYECSACKERTSIFSGAKNYCPNCGAKMEGDKDGK